MDPTDLEPFDLGAVVRMNAGEQRERSEFHVALDPDGELPTAFAWIERARELNLELEEVEAGEGDLLRLSSPAVEIVLRPTELTLEQGARTSRGPLPDTEVEALRRTRHEAVFRMTLGEPVLEQMHLAIVTMVHLFPDSLAVWDMARFLWLDRERLVAAATTAAPPPPDELYTMHSVASDDRAWLHTHGLERCGTIELEVFCEPSSEDVTDLASLLRVVACRFVDQGTPPSGEPFEVGQDLALAWLPWDRALQISGFEPSELGGIEDRGGHDGLVGTLFAYREDAPGVPGYPGLAPITDLLPGLRDNPLFYLSSMETRRMSALATEHFPVFRRLLTRRGGRPDWRFLVKLGYAVDDDEEGTEHLWFEAHGFENGRIDGTLLNEPYGIQRMHEGQRDLHPVDQLSHWTVEVGDEVFGPERADELERLHGPSRPSDGAE